MLPYLGNLTVTLESIVIFPFVFVCKTRKRKQDTQVNVEAKECFQQVCGTLVHAFGTEFGKILHFPTNLCNTKSLWTISALKKKRGKLEQIINKQNYEQQLQPSDLRKVI